jgi:hypothetical protein
MLSSLKILNIFARKEVAEEVTLNVGRDFEIEDMPEMNEESIVRLRRVTSRDEMNVEVLILALNVSENGSDVRLYITKLEREV